MVALANSPKAAGELTVIGTSAGGEAPSVTINGEAAKSGRSIFSSSIINTPENAGAIVDLGKLGKLELAPNSAMVLSFNDNQISGSLTAGKITVLGAAKSVNMTIADGSVVNLAAGDSATAAGAAARQDTDNDGNSAAWWGLAAVLGGAAALIIYTATRDNNVEVGGGGTVVSPVR